MNARRVLLCLVLAVILMLPVSVVSSTHSARLAPPSLIPTKLCTCQSAQGASLSLPELRSHRHPNQVNYDEQLGITFAQSFTSLEYNVTPVEQTDPTLNTGPAYLLNGLSNAGYWYQVGVSWNWGPGSTPGTGFGMNYEVFDSAGNSIFPTQGGGMSSFSGPVNEGDTVALNLYFGNSSQVVMIAEDLATGASAEQTFSSEGASSFVGLPNSVAASNGFFTGLMTEWYHGNPYYSNLKEAAYSTNFPISSGWMWMDEWTPQSNVLVFDANASAPTSFTSEPSTLQEFSYNSTTEYADATRFITGALNSTSQVTMTFGYSVQGGGSGYGAPVLTYVSNRTQQTSALSTTPTAYKLDEGTPWSVSGTLPGSTSGEKWVTSDTTSGTATSGAVVSVQYQTQYYVVITLNNPDGGSVQPSSGWQIAGTTLQVVATSDPGWKFEGWSTANQASPANSPATLSIQVSAPVNETATFYPGLVVTASSSVSVSFSFVGPSSGETGQGTVQPGTTQTIYVPPSSEVALKANPTSFLYSSGWNMAGSSPSGSTATLEVSQPASIAAVSTYDYLNMGIIVGALVLVAAVIVLALARRRRTSAVEGQTARYPGLTGAKGAGDQLVRNVVNRLALRYPALREVTE